MTEAQFQLVRAIAFAGSAALALGLERLRPHARVQRSLRVNLGMWGVNAVLIGLVCGACACTVARWAADHGVGLIHWTRAPSWVGLLLTLGVLDLLSYAWHRANHGWSVLWRFHQVHHSDPTFTASTAVRFHPGELLLSLPVRLSVVLALGAPVLGVVVFEAAFALANFLEHGNIDYPRWLERRMEGVLVTPALHRRHHGKDASLLGTNFGTIFSFWDRALGTFGRARSTDQVETGLAGAEAATRLAGALGFPFSRSPVPVPQRAL